MSPDEPSPVEEFLSAAGSREKSGSRVDYDSLATAGIVAVLSSPLGSINRAYALMDLQDLLAPYQDESFQVDWGKLNEEYLDEGEDEEEKETARPIIRYPNHPINNGGSTPDRGTSFQREWFRLLIRLMKKKGLLPAGYI